MRRRDRHNREAEIVDAAVDVFSRRGYARAAIQAIADEAGVQKGSLYHYIQSKEDLLFRICEDVQHDIRALMSESSQLDTGALGRLRAFLAGFIEMCAADRNRGAIFLREWRQLEGARRTRIEGQMREIQEFIASLLREATAEGGRGPDVQPDTIALFLFAALDGLAELITEGRVHGEEAGRYADLAVAAALGTAVSVVGRGDAQR